MSLLLLAFAGLLWPAARTRLRVAGPTSPEVSPGVARSGWWSAVRYLPGSREHRNVGATGVIRPLARTLGVSVLGLAVAGAGAAGLLAAGLLILTARWLIQGEMRARRRRIALLDLLAGLRMLTRELRAGADPAVAASNAAAAADGDGARVLTGLAQLARSDDRATGRDRADPVGFGQAGRGRRANSSAGTGSAAADVAEWAATRLRSGWLLTRRHGLAFTPLIDALVQELAEQVQADAERSGQVAGPRMSGYVMALLPMLGLVLGAGMGADPVRVLLRSGVGNVLLIVGVALTCAGLLWSARIVRLR